jgi:superfamily I DNA/RNA helicase
MADTTEQTAIYEAACYTEDNIAVNALAGSGKTHVAVGVAQRIQNRNTRFVAFNGHIAEELTHRLGDCATASTLHSVGLRVLNTQRRRRVESTKYTAILKRQFPHIHGKNGFLLGEYRALPKLINIWRNELVPADATPEQAGRLLRAPLTAQGWEYPEDTRKIPEFLGIAGSTIQTGLEDHIQVDFTDMITMPSYLGLTSHIADLLIADEAQDFNPAQQELVAALAPRTIHVGDPRQAIMLFAGASSTSFTDLTDRLQSRVLPLSTCWRCPTSHLDLARILIPRITARPDAPIGTVTDTTAGIAARNVQPGNLVICRNNAPLLGMAYALMAKRVPCKIRGRDIAAGLESLIKKLRVTSISQLTPAVALYRPAQAERLRQRDATDSTVESHHDQCDCLESLADMVGPTGTLDDITILLRDLFGDHLDDANTVVLSSIHRAKGSEADTVIVLWPELLGRARGTAEAQIQEVNLAYIALTRARKHLILADGPRSERPDTTVWLSEMAGGYND